jgi:hypothetical protein
VENLSALFETLLLLVTCFWIIYEATHRLLYHTADLEVNYWSFTVMITSIVVDVSRSRMLYRAAKKYNSQALEADALHFSTDIWSSAVVLFGLACVKLSQLIPGSAFLQSADAVAALIVALSDDSTMALEPEVLRQMINQVSFAAAGDDSRPVLTGVLADISAAGLTMLPGRIAAPFIGALVRVAPVTFQEQFQILSTTETAH